MALISQNWTRGVLKESGRLTGDERVSFCVTETNKRQIQSEQTGRQRRWRGGWKTSSEAEQLVKRATVAPKVKAEVERNGRGRGEKISVGLESLEVKCCRDGMES